MKFILINPGDIISLSFHFNSMELFFPTIILIFSYVSLIYILIL